MAEESYHPMKSLVDEWLRKIDLAKKVKHEQFGQYAVEAARFYDGSHDWMWKSEYAGGPNGFLDKDGARHLPTFKMTVNKPFEAVALFGPALMHRYPQCTVSPVTPPIFQPLSLGLDPNDPAAVEEYQAYLQSEQLFASQKEARSSVAQHYLNWLQIEASKKNEARMAITEAIVKGLGILWTEIYQPVGSQIRYPRSRFVSVDDIQKDPDAQYHEDVMWVARRNCVPINIAARKFGLRMSDLRGHLQSYASQSTKKGAYDRKSKKAAETTSSYDLIEYWDIYSKNGMGQHLKTTSQQSYKSKYDFDWMGDYTYLAVAKGIPYPLNFPSWALAEAPEEQFDRVQWPIPFWTDAGLGNGWPFAELHFYDKLNCVWPISLIKPAIGEIRFVNWCMSFLADKVAASATTYVAMAKAAGYEIKNQLEQGLAPYTVIEISELLGTNVRDLISFIDAPSFSIDIWRMVAEVMELIDKRTGLTELIYGLTGTQMRSATEADARQSNVSIRPDDMAERTEDWYSQTNMKEIEAAVWSLDGDDVQGVLGPTGASIFEEMQLEDFESIVRDYNYRIQSGSARKPNKTNRLRSLNEWGQHALPVIQQFAMQGHVEPWNAYMGEVAKALDFDAGPFLIELPPPQDQPDPEQVELEAKLHREQQEFEQEYIHKEQEHDQDLDHQQEEHNLAMRLKRSESNATPR